MKAEVSPAARSTATASRLCWLISKFWGSFIVLAGIGAAGTVTDLGQNVQRISAIKEYYTISIDWGDH